MLLMQEAQVQSLIRELDPTNLSSEIHMPHAATESSHVPQLRPGTDKLVNKCLKNTYETNQAEKCQESG